MKLLSLVRISYTDSALWGHQLSWVWAVRSSSPTEPRAFRGGAGTHLLNGMCTGLREVRLVGRKERTSASGSTSAWPFYKLLSQLWNGKWLSQWCTQKLISMFQRRRWLWEAERFLQYLSSCCSQLLETYDLVMRGRRCPFKAIPMCSCGAFGCFKSNSSGVWSQNNYFYQCKHKTRVTHGPASELWIIAWNQDHETHPCLCFIFRKPKTVPVTQDS